MARSCLAASCGRRGIRTWSSSSRSTALDEARHSWLWERTIVRLGLATRAHSSQLSELLSRRDRFRRAADGALALTHVFEQRVHTQFTEDLAQPGLPEAARRTFNTLLRDEAAHLDWIASWLESRGRAEAMLHRYREADERMYCGGWLGIAIALGNRWPETSANRQYYASNYTGTARAGAPAFHASFCVSGRWHLLPVYDLMTLSDLGERPSTTREAIALPITSTLEHRQAERLWAAGSTHGYWQCQPHERSAAGVKRPREPCSARSSRTAAMTAPCEPLAIPCAASRAIC